MQTKERSRWQKIANEIQTRNVLNSYLECEYLICGINGQGGG